MVMNVLLADHRKWPEFKTVLHVAKTISCNWVLGSNYGGRCRVVPHRFLNLRPALMFKIGCAAQHRFSENAEKSCKLNYMACMGRRT